MKNKILHLIKTENIIAIAMLIYFILIPSVSSAYGLIQYNTFLIMIILSLSLSFVWGYTGIFSFCQAVFFGVGGYTYAVLYMFFGDIQMTPVYALIAILAAAVVAAILGIFMFYGGINDVFVGLITLLVTLILYKFMQTATGDGWFIHGKNGKFDLGGWTGMRGIARIQFGSKMLDPETFYMISLAILVIIYIVLRVMKVTKPGFAIMAIRENRERSELFGYNVPLTQTIVFAIGGAIAAIAGILYVSHTGGIAIGKIDVASSTMPLVIVATAGRKNPTAAVVFTFIYYLLDSVLASSGGQWTPIIMGTLLILVILFLPNGLLTSIFNKIDELFIKLTGRKSKILTEEE